MKKTFTPLLVQGLAALVLVCTGNHATAQVSGSVSNYSCSEAITISTYQYTNSQSTAGASSADDPAPSCVSGFGSGVWYEFRPDSNGQLVADTMGSDFDTGLAVYTGHCGSLSLVACDDDGGGNLTSKITTSLIAGEMYYVLAGGYAGSTGNLAFHSTFTPTAPPASLGIQMQGSVAVLTLNGSVKGVYEILYSTNLNSPTNWSLLATLTLPQSPYLLHEFSSTNRPLTFYRSRLQPPAVPAPQIGWVGFVKDTLGDYVSSLQVVTSFVFNNDVTIAILASEGAETHFTFGPTPVNPLLDMIPNPSPSVGSTPGKYRNGLFAYDLPPSIIQPQPDVTIKAISFQSGWRNSPIVASRFQFRVANPIIQGTNAASFTLIEQTVGSQLWYTTDGSDPTNQAPSTGPLTGSASGTSVSISPPTNFTFKVRGFRDNYQPSDVISRGF